MSTDPKQFEHMWYGGMVVSLSTFVILMVLQWVVAEPSQVFMVRVCAIVPASYLIICTPAWISEKRKNSRRRDG